MKIKIFSISDLSNANSIILHLANYLSENNDVILYTKSFQSDLPNGRFKVRIIFPNIKALKYLYYRIYLFFDLNFKKSDLIFIHNYQAFPYLFRKKRIVLFLTEFYSINEQWTNKLINSKNSFINFLEKGCIKLIIDSNNSRRELRQLELHKYCSTKFMSIRNSIPFKAYRFPNAQKKNYIIYSGGSGYGYGLEFIILAISGVKVNSEWEFNLFVYDQSVVDLRKKFKREIDNSFIKINFHERIEKADLYHYMAISKIGIGFYNPDISLNFQYCAPTKIYEYLLNNVITLFTNNRSIIDDFSEDEIITYNPKSYRDLSSKLEKLINDPFELQRRELLLNGFNKELHFNNDNDFNYLNEILNEINKSERLDI